MNDPEPPFETYEPSGLDDHTEYDDRTPADRPSPAVFIGMLILIAAIALLAYFLFGDGHRASGQSVKSTERVSQAAYQAGIAGNNGKPKPSVTKFAPVETNENYQFTTYVTCRQSLATFSSDAGYDYGGSIAAPEFMNPYCLGVYKKDGTPIHGQFERWTTYQWCMKNCASSDDLIRMANDLLSHAPGAPGNR